MISLASLQAVVDRGPCDSQPCVPSTSVRHHGRDVSGPSPRRWCRPRCHRDGGERRIGKGRRNSSRRLRRPAVEVHVVQLAGRERAVMAEAAPSPAAIRAASAIAAGSRPASCTTWTSTAGRRSRREELRWPFANSPLATISVTTRPAPWAWARARNASSVMPDRGARNTRLRNSRRPRSTTACRAR